MPKVTDEHRAARREQILDAAVRRVAAEGFHRTTMADVIAESGLSAGAVYGYFRSKQDLIRAIADRVGGLVAATIEGLIDADPPVPPAAALEAVLERVVAAAADAGYDVPTVAIQAWAEAARDPEVREIVAAKMRRVRDSWTTYAERARDAGLLAPDADPAAVARTMLGLMPGFLVVRLVLGDVTPHSHAAGLAELMRSP